jgi:hypothetical protein
MNVLAGHPRQASALALPVSGVYVPIGQAWHCAAAVRPTLVLKRFAGHGVHAGSDTPVWFEKDPAGHGWHAATLRPPTTSLNVPIGH